MCVRQQLPAEIRPFLSPSVRCAEYSLQASSKLCCVLVFCPHREGRVWDACRRQSWWRPIWPGSQSSYSVVLGFQVQSKELIYFEDELHYIFAEDIASIELKVYLNYLFDNLSAIDLQVGQYYTFIVWPNFDNSKILLRPLKSSYPIGRESETAKLVCQYLVDTPTKSISVPLLCFMDAFGL